MKDCISRSVHSVTVTRPLAAAEVSETGGRLRVPEQITQPCAQHPVYKTMTANLSRAPHFQTAGLSLRKSRSLIQGGCIQSSSQVPELPGAQGECSALSGLPPVVSCPPQPSLQPHPLSSLLSRLHKHAKKGPWLELGQSPEDQGGKAQ